MVWSGDFTLGSHGWIDVATSAVWTEDVENEVLRFGKKGNT